MKKAKVFIIIAVIVVIAAMGGVIFYLLQNKTAAETPAPDKSERRNVGTVVTEDNLKDVVASMESQKEATPPGRYEVVQSVDWHFDDPAAVSKDAYVENAKSNKNTVYFTLSTTVEDSGVFYTSPDIPVGSHLEGISLDGALENGTHNCILTYHLLDEDGNEQSDVSLALTIYVGK